MSLEKIIKQTGDKPKLVVIWMHGLGADGHDFEPVVPQFQIDGLAIKFVFPHAPKIPVTINGGMVMRAWYDIKMMDIGKHAAVEGVLSSEKRIHELIDEQIGLGFKHEQIILAGFSQGGAMSLHTSIRYKYKLAGIIALSCYLPMTDHLPSEDLAVNKKTPIFMAHGTQDPVVPYFLGKSGYETLKQQNYTIQWREYPLQHGVSMDEIYDIKEWLIQNFKK